jgi:hypothetical protein
MADAWKFVTAKGPSTLTTLKLFASCLRSSRLTLNRCAVAHLRGRTRADGAANISEESFRAAAALDRCEADRQRSPASSNSVMGGKYVTALVGSRDNCAPTCLDIDSGFGCRFTASTLAIFPSPQLNFHTGIAPTVHRVLLEENAEKTDVLNRTSP